MQGVYGEAVCFPYTEYILRQNKSHFFQSADRRGKMTIADLTGRVEAKTTISILNANRPCAEHLVVEGVRKELLQAVADISAVGAAAQHLHLAVVELRQELAA